MRFWHFLAVLVLSTQLACAPAQVPTARAPLAAPSTPNIVFILADDLRHDMLGVAGNKQIHTPNLDHLARRGVYFTQAASLIPQCCPARAVMITGLTPHQSGYTSIDLQAPGAGELDSFERFPTLPSLLRDRGYHTVLVGKWHIKPDPWRSGFSETRTWFAGGMCHYDNPILCRGESRDTHTVTGNITEIFASDSIEFLTSPRAAQKPFFLWVAPTAPHEPCGPVPERISAQYQGMTPKDLVRDGITLGSSPRWDDLWVAYYQSVTHLDEQVGRILAALDSSGLASSTLIVFVSDSGIMMGRRGIGSKVVPYEDSIRIPIIISAPWLSPRTIEAPVSDLDLPPTILHLVGAGEAVPESWLGRNLAPAATSGDTKGLDFSISLWPEGQSSAWGEWSNRTIRTPDHKLIVWESKPTELYTLSRDPHEQTNLAGEPDAATMQLRLQSQLQQWLRRANDPATTWPAMSDAKDR